METRKLSDIKPYPKNAKKHPAEQVKKIADSIKEFGFQQPIVVDKDGVIIVGHGRYMAALTLDLKEVPVIEVDLPKDKVKAYRIADNKLNESGWDMKLVIEELKDLDIKMADLTGFSIENLDSLEVVLDPQKEWDGMPEFESNNLKPKRQIIVSFKSDQDVKDFAKLIGQNITDRTRSLWFPEAMIDSVKKLRY